MGEMFRQGETAGAQPMRIAKYLANAGIASRRTAEEWIAQGRIQVNGEVLSTPSVLVTPGKDRICCDGRTVELVSLRYILLNKPAGYTCTAEDRHAEHLIYELLPENLRHLRYVGRLDRETQGLLLLTNDGELVHALTHPSRQVPKVYAAYCRGTFSRRAAEQMLRGVWDEEEFLRAREVRLHRNLPDGVLLHLTLTEGKKREVRRLCAKAGLPVLRLARISQGSLKLGELPEGEWRDLTPEEIQGLQRDVRRNANSGGCGENTFQQRKHFK